ncbi:MAG: glutaminyl-peptide cyclotransferase [Bacteroidota bacterium]|jgi:glutamine cyclotransferase
MNIKQYNYRNALIIIALFFCGCGETRTGSVISTPPAPKTLSFSIQATYPHDTAAYTQGLVVYKGAMYEGTGNYGRSELRKVDLPNGKTLQRATLGEKYFGEGITILRDTVYQLTWQEKKVFVYSLPGFKKIKEFDVTFDGWGLTHDGTNLIVSNGSGELFFYRPQDFTLIRSQAVVEAGTPSFNLNELEYIDGFIYANQYTYPYVLKIDPNTGEVVAKIDLTDIWNRNRRAYPKADVPNGIAYDPDSKKIFITGKWWPELYEIQLSN